MDTMGIVGVYWPTGNYTLPKNYDQRTLIYQQISIFGQCADRRIAGISSNPDEIKFNYIEN